jgi:acyl carrier protein
MTELISCLNDKAEIEKWIEKAEAIAKENYADRIHEFANVLRQDYFEKAMYWYSVAAQMGYEKSVYQLEIINLVSEYHKTKDESVFFEAIRKIIVMCLEKSDDEVSEISKFNQDLGADDLDMYELAYKIEEELGVSIPDEDLCDDIEEDAEYSFKFQTVKELFDLCKKYKLNN